MIMLFCPQITQMNSDGFLGFDFLICADLSNLWASI